MDTLSETLEVSDVTHWDKERHFFKAKPIALTNTNVRGKFELPGYFQGKLKEGRQIDSRPTGPSYCG